MSGKSKLQKIVEWAIAGAVLGFWFPGLMGFGISVAHGGIGAIGEFFTMSFEGWAAMLEVQMRLAYGTVPIGAILGITLATLIARDDPGS